MDACVIMDRFLQETPCFAMQKLGQACIGGSAWMRMEEGRRFQMSVVGIVDFDQGNPDCSACASCYY
jgi:hypothetical protein